MPGMATRLRELIQRDGMLAAPGCYDCITARAIERHGFDAAYMSGGGTSFSRGFPDYGLITMSEMVDNAGRIANTIKIPLIADADTGFGNELNVTRTVREFDQRGVAGIHLEDQEFPKRCGHLEGKRVIDLDQYLQRIKAAAAARQNPDFVIIARTDARAIFGLDHAIERANASLAAGADIAFVEAPESMADLVAIPQRVKGPCLINMSWSGKTPRFSTGDAQAMGYKVGIQAGVLLRSILEACDMALTELRTTGLHPTLKNDLNVAKLFAANGAGEWDELRRRFSTVESDPWQKAQKAS